MAKQKYDNRREFVVFDEAQAYRLASWISAQNWNYREQLSGQELFVKAEQVEDILVDKAHGVRRSMFSAARMPSLSSRTKNLLIRSKMVNLEMSFNSVRVELESSVSSMAYREEMLSACQVTFKNVYYDLLSLIKRFDCTIKWLTRKLCVLIEDVQLCGRDFGNYLVEIDFMKWLQLANNTKEILDGADSRFLSVDKTSEDQLAPYGENTNIYHPHISSGGNVCFGVNQETAVNRMVCQVRFVDLIDMVEAVLRNYNENSAYAEIRCWTEEQICSTCSKANCELVEADCGHSVCDSCLYTCERRLCDSTSCRDCKEVCRSCNRILCEGHSGICENDNCDNGTVCTGCSNRCCDCERLYCSDCLSTCNSCNELLCEGCTTDSGLCIQCDSAMEESVEEESSDTEDDKEDSSDTENASEDSEEENETVQPVEAPPSVTYQPEDSELAVSSPTSASLDPGAVQQDPPVVNGMPDAIMALLP